MLTAVLTIAGAGWKWISAAFMALISTPIGAAAAVGIAFMVWNAKIDNPRVAKEATAKCLGTVEKAALQAQIELERQRREAAERALAGYRRLAAEDAAAAEAHAAELEMENAEYEKKLAESGRSCRLSADDVKRVLDNRKKLGGGR